MEENAKNNQLDDEKLRTLYVRWPKTINDDKEVTNLFSNDVKIKLPRQKSRCCHIIFSTIKKREKYLKTMKDKLNINGKRIIIMPLKEKNLDRRKNKITRQVETLKKVVVPRPQQSSVQSLFVTDIPKETKAQEVKDAFPECTTLALLNARDGKNSKSAIIKMSNIKFATAYLNNENPAPTINGNTVKIFPYKKRSKSLKKKLKTMLQKLDNSSEIKIDSNDDE